MSEEKVQQAVDSLKANSNRAVFSTNRDKHLLTAKQQDPLSRLTEGQRHLLSCHLTRVYKILNNKFPNFRHVGDRCKALNDLAAQYKTGYPWKNNDIMKQIATPILVARIEALSYQLMEIEKVKYGRDLGHLDGTTTPTP